MSNVKLLYVHNFIISRQDDEEDKGNTGIHLAPSVCATVVVLKLSLPWIRMSQMKLVSNELQGHGFSGNILRFLESVLKSVVQNSEFLFK